MLKRNVGSLDRVLRVALGIALLLIVFIGPRTPWGWIGLIPLLTGLFGTCPFYRLIGASTRAGR